MYNESLDNLKDELTNKLKFYADQEEYDKVKEINKLLQTINKYEQSCVSKLKKVYEVY